MLLDNEKGGDLFPAPVEERAVVSEKRRAILVGPVWSADLAEALMEVYSHLLNEGYTLEDVSKLAQDLGDDCSGD